MAQYELSFWYSFGGPKENLESIELLKKAAYQGIPEAQYSLYCFYSRGRAYITTVRNMPEALKWLYKAAENNCVEAQYELANLYYRGDGVLKDEKTGDLWLRRARINEGKWK